MSHLPDEQVVRLFTDKVNYNYLSTSHVFLVFLNALFKYIFR